MFFKFDHTLNRLRSTGSWEAVSYLLLLFVAMPLKYIWNWPEAVRVVGMAHGLLWIAYVGLAILSQLTYRWPHRITVWLFVASLLPFGPFVAEAKLLRTIKA